MICAGELMREFSRPRVVISRCIGFEPVRWDGGIIFNAFVESLKAHIETITVCPEVEVGLSVPRKPIRKVKKDNKYRLIQLATGQDLTEKMQQVTDKILEGLPEVDGFILKSRSPSCGINDTKIYSNIEESMPLTRGSGFFGAAVAAKFGNLAVEDEERLLNPHIQKHFLTKLYTLSDFRAVKMSKSINKLIDFQSHNKLLFTAYNQKELHSMERIVVHSKNRPFPEVIAEYQNHLWNALRQPPRKATNANVFVKAAGYLTSRLYRTEKELFRDTVMKYKAGKLPLSVPLNVLKTWINRFNEPYLMQQTFLEPYPEVFTNQESTITNINCKATGKY